MTSQEKSWKTKRVDNYVVKNQLLGEGQFGKVYRAVELQNPKKEYACKVIQVNNIHQKDQELLKQEISALSALNSQYIVKLHKVSKTAKNYYFIMELCLEGTLHEILEKKPKKRFSEEETVQIFKHIIEAFKEMNAKNIVHRDIKLDNVMFKQGIAKITDFGFAQIKQDANKAEKQTAYGTPLYMAPQLLRNQPYSSKCDVWSVGILIYELLYGRTPWEAIHLTDLEYQICHQQLTFPNLPYRSTKIKQLLINMLHKEEKDRFSWQQVFDDVLFKTPAKYVGASSILHSTDLNQFSGNSCTQSALQNIQNMNQEVFQNQRVAGYLKNLDEVNENEDELEIAEEITSFNSLSVILQQDGQDQKNLTEFRKKILEKHDQYLFLRNKGYFFSFLAQIYLENMENFIQKYGLQKEQANQILLLLVMKENIYHNQLSSDFQEEKLNCQKKRRNSVLTPQSLQKLNYETKNTQKNTQNNNNQYTQKYFESVESYKIKELLEKDLDQSHLLIKTVFSQLKSQNLLNKEFKQRLQNHSNYLTHQGDQLLKFKCDQLMTETQLRKADLNLNPNLNPNPNPNLNPNHKLNLNSNSKTLVQNIRIQPHKALQRQLSNQENSIQQQRRGSIQALQSVEQIPAQVHYKWVRSKLQKLLPEFFSHLKENLKFFSKKELQFAKYMQQFNFVDESTPKNLDFCTFYEDIDNEDIKQLQNYLETNL